MPLSKSQIDRLGDRLRLGTDTEDDLHELDDYRRSFRPAYEAAAAAIRTNLGVEATGREAKTTAAIVAKLRRQNIRLAQIQDIAGLRVIAADPLDQQMLVERLITMFGGASVDDRRTRPSHGYRAVHVIAQTEGKPVEIQVRTREQHLWAELSERIADAVDPAVKYGGGPLEIRRFLDALSEKLDQVEAVEREVLTLERDAAQVRRQVELLEQNAEQAGISLEEIQQAEGRIANLKVIAMARKQQLADLLTNLTAAVKQLRSERQ